VLFWGGIRFHISSTHILRHVGERVKDGVHGIDVGELHELPIGELPAVVELASSVARLKDVESRDLIGTVGTQGH